MEKQRFAYESLLPARGFGFLGNFPYLCIPTAELAQLVERWLPKPKVASSNLVFRSVTGKTGISPGLFSFQDIIRHAFETRGAEIGLDDIALQVHAGADEVGMVHKVEGVADASFGKLDGDARSLGRY